MNKRIEVELGEDLPIGTAMRLRALREGREQGHREMLLVMAADCGATPAELNAIQNTATIQEMREFVTALATRTRSASS